MPGGAELVREGKEVEEVKEVNEVDEAKEVKEKALRGASVNGDRLNWYDQRGVPPCFCVRVAGKGVRGQRIAESWQPTADSLHSIRDEV